MLDRMRAWLVAALVLGAGVAHAGPAEPLLRYLPDDASHLVTVDVAHQRTSAPGLARIVAQLRAHLPPLAAAADAGIDLGAAVDTVLVAASTAPDGRSAHLTVVIDGDVVALLAHLHPAGAHPARVSQVYVYDLGGVEAAIVDRHLVLAPAGEMASVIARGHRAAAALADTARTATALRAILAIPPDGADVRGGTLIDAGLQGFLTAQLGGEARWIAFAIGSGDRVSLDVRLAFRDPAGASGAAGKLARLLAGGDSQLRPTLETFVGPELAESLAVDQDGAEVHLSASMPAGESEQLGNLLGKAW